MGIKSNNPVESYYNYFGASGTDAVNVAPLGPFSATGGEATSTPGDGYKYHYYTASGALTVSGDPSPIQYLVVGGGGGGGGHAGGGGGGGGGVRCNIPSIPTVTASAAYTCTGPLTVTVGEGGGFGGTGYFPTSSGGESGGDSEIYPPGASYPSTTRVRGAGGGGAGGGNPGTSPTDRIAKDGGSGGGRNGILGADPSGGDTITDPNFPAVQGYAGGGTVTPNYLGGGGGGASEAGESATPTYAGDGGTGVGIPPAVVIPASYGTPGPTAGRWFGGGGGGGSHMDDPKGTGGAGGGANGRAYDTPPGGGPGAWPNTPNGLNGTATSGGGGGGAGGAQGVWADSGGDGGDGFVLIRYPI